MDENLAKLSSIYFQLEEVILKQVEKLPEYGNKCECDEPTNFFIVDDDTIIGYCLNCGGDS